MSDKYPMRHLLLLLPGIMGSVLQKDGKDIWALSGQALWQYVRTARKADTSLHLLRVAGDDWQQDDLGDGITATRLIADLHSVPGLVEHAGYSVIVRRLSEYFDVTEGIITAPTDDANFFPFPYDWRRDIRANARLLQRFIERQLPRWRDWSGASDAQAIIVAHSMGGLASRYYLEVLGGWRDCRALITVGTPHRGAVGPLDMLSNGIKKGFLDLSEIVRSFTSAYQVLPTYPLLELGGAYIRVAETNAIPNIDQQRAKAAREEFHEAILATAQQNRTLPGYRQCTIPWVGTRQATLQSALLQQGRLTPRYEPPAYLDPVLAEGDGTVPRISAVPADLDGQRFERFAVERHGWLTNNEMTLEPLLETLVQCAVSGTKELHGEADPSYISISLRLEPVYLTTEVVTVQVSVAGHVADSAPQKLELRVEPVGLQAEITTRQFTVSPGEATQVAIENLAPGLYQMTVRLMPTPGRPPSPPAQVHGIFEVVDASEV